MGRYYGYTEREVGKLTPRQIRMYMNQIEHVERMMSGEEAAPPPVTDAKMIEEHLAVGLKPPIKE